MQIFRRNIYSQITKRQEQDRIMRELDEEIKLKNEEYEAELAMDWDEEDEDEGGRA